jgi:hypothetical protein
MALFAAGAIAVFLIPLFPGTAFGQYDTPKKTPVPSSLSPEEARKFRKQKKALEEQKKIKTLSMLIQNVNKKLKLRTSGQKEFDRKQALENRLRDRITLFNFTNQAMAEAVRLAREVEEIRRTNRNGPNNSRRLQLANFLEARRREYILFATR